MEQEVKNEISQAKLFGILREHERKEKNIFVWMIVVVSVFFYGLCIFIDSYAAHLMREISGNAL